MGTGLNQFNDRYSWFLRDWSLPALPCGLYKPVISTSQGYTSEVFTVSKLPQRNTWWIQGPDRDLARISSLARVTSINTQPLVLSCQPLPCFTTSEVANQMGSEIQNRYQHRIQLLTLTNWFAKGLLLQMWVVISECNWTMQGKRWALLKSSKEVLGVSTPIGCINWG